MEPTPVEFRTTRGRMALYALGSLAFVVLGAVMALDPKTSWWFHLWGGVCVVFFTICLGIALVEIVRPGMGLRLDAEGIHVRHVLGRRLFDLPWEELAGVRLVVMSRQPIVVFDPVDPEWGLAESGPAARASRKANRALVGSWMTVAPRLYGVRPEPLLAEVERWRRAALPDAGIEYPRPVSFAPL